MKKIQVCSKEETNFNPKPINKEITVFKNVTRTEYKDGKRIEYTEKEPVNLTRKINETAKILKQETAKEKLEKIQKALSL